MVYWGSEDDKRAICADIGKFSEASSQSEYQQSRYSECRTVRIGKWVQVEMPAQRIWQLEYHIRPLATMVKKRCAAKSGFDVAAEGHYSGSRENHIA